MLNAAAAVRIRKEPDLVWRTVGAFSAIGKWHPLISRLQSEGEVPGARREAETLTGETEVDRLEEMCPPERFYRYRIEQTPMPVRNCMAELRVDDNGDGTSTVNWRSEFEVTAGDEARAVQGVQDFLDAGLDNLQKLCV